MSNNQEDMVSKRVTMLRDCDNLIEKGEIGNARTILIGLLESCQETQELESILERANTIKALEIIELCFEKKKNKTTAYAESLKEEIDNSNKEREKGLEALLGKFI